MMIIGRTPVGEYIQTPDITNPAPESRFPWKVEMNYQDGGFIKSWYMGANDVPIKAINFSKSEIGDDNGSLAIPVLDFPVYYGNEVLVSYNGIRRWRGFVGTEPDSKGDKISLKPYFDRLGEFTVNSTYASQTFEQIANDVINTKSEYTKVLFNSGMFNYTDTSVQSPSYKYEKLTKPINDIYQNENNSYYGVEENGFFFIRKHSTVVDHTLYWGDNMAYSSLKPKTNYNKIKQTYFNVFISSSGANKKDFLGTVPDGTTDYPSISLETIVGRKYKNITFPQGLSTAECLDLAYAKLTDQIAPTNIKIKDIDLQRYDLKVGDKLRIWDRPELQLKTLVDCDSTDSWTGAASLDSNVKVRGDASITWNSDDTIIHDLGETKVFKGMTKISMMVWSGSFGGYINVSLGKNLIGYSYGNYSEGNYSEQTMTDALFLDNTQIYLRTVNTWNLVQIETTEAFRYIAFSSTSGKSATMRVDEIQVYAYQQKMYEGNIIDVDYKIDSGNWYLYDAQIGEYEVFVNERLEELEKKLEVAEAAAKV